MPRLPRITGAEIAKALERGEFELARVKGSHYIYRYRGTGRRVVVPIHGNRIIPPGTLLNILGQAGLEAGDLVKLLQQ